MDFQKLLQGKTITETELIFENWYQRLNNLKDKYGQPIDGIENDKARRIIFQLCNRLTIASQILLHINQPRSNYKKGTL